MIEQMEAMLKEVKSISRKKGLKTGITIAETQNQNNPKTFFPPLRYAEGIAIANVITSDKSDVIEICKVIDGNLDFIFVDNENKKINLLDIVTTHINKSNINTFRPNDMTVDAADALIIKKFSSLDGKNILIMGAGNIGSKLALKLVERGADIFIYRRDFLKCSVIADGLNNIKSSGVNSTITPIKTIRNIDFSKIDILIGSTSGYPVIKKKHLMYIKDNAYILDVGIGNLDCEAIEFGLSRGIELIRLDMRAGFTSQIALNRETDLLVEKVMGEKVSNGGKRFVAGGKIGKKNDVIVDNITNPSEEIGIADGRGGLIR
ncbi:2-dehydropantoate 2-reductase [Rossellomorea sp. KS-H15a]|uniref:2-dehydropantoate 2-reductase n=1 Tax=Rossellomorea sp. KS-H15a TaxID=2963940 RepID=UPI0020C6C50B|nr:2-dehydropantoate 2-reductase [Rossellomorea sp. KS-H15a]UTE77496.1 2-dehydropantoate 2-reductase [Rossellomorea sp. KS-H15a]